MTKLPQIPQPLLEQEARTSDQLDKEMEDKIHIYNESTQTFDIINMRTGEISKVGKDIGVPRNNNVFSWQLADSICELIRNGSTLARVSKMQGMPSRGTLAIWERMHPLFASRLEAARKDRAENYHDMALDVAMSCTNKEEVPIAKLQVDVLKWAAEKGDPKRYSAKGDSDTKGGGVTIIIETGVPTTQAQVWDTTAIEVDSNGEFKGTDPRTEVHGEGTQSESTGPDRQKYDNIEGISAFSGEEIFGADSVSQFQGRERDGHSGGGSSSYTFEPLDTSGADVSGTGEKESRNRGSYSKDQYWKKEQASEASSKGIEDEGRQKEETK